MAKYLYIASYTQAGLQGLLADGGTKREEAVRSMAEGLGGTLESFYFAFGDNDLYVVCDMPDDVSAATAAVTAGAGGGASVKTVVLLSPGDIDAASKKSVEYRAPGQ